MLWLLKRTVSMRRFFEYPQHMFWLRNKKTIFLLLFDFINLTQVQNFTVSAQDIFTFRRLSVFTISFTGILQVVMR